MPTRIRSPRSVPRLQARHAASSLRKTVYVCQKCGAWHQPSPIPGTTRTGPPAQCLCGWLLFDYFDSKTEAQRWATLKMLERRGKIIKLRRQVRYPLHAYCDGKPVKVADYIADFCYAHAETPDVEVAEDSKPRAGIDDLARLKLKWMEAQGVAVLITH